MFQRLLLLWLVLLSWLAYRWPVWFPEWEDPFLLTQTWNLLSPTFAVAMFAIGSLLPAADVDAVVRRWPTVLGGTAIQYASMPLLAYGVGRAFDLPGDLLAGVIVVGCVPGAMASNVLTHAARGNTSYSVSLTTSATIVSPIVVPFVLWLALDRGITVDPIATSIQLSWTVVLPVVAGHLSSRRFPEFERIANRIGPIVANVVILWIIAVVVAIFRKELSGVTPLVAWALLALNVLGYAAGALGGWLLRLPGSMRRALVLEVGMQNAGLGSLIVLQQMKDHLTAAIPTAGYTFGCMLTGTILAGVWSAFPPEDATTNEGAELPAEGDEPEHHGEPDGE